MFDVFGLNEAQMMKMVEETFEKNADILMGIDDPEMQEMLDILKRSFISTIQKNNEQLTEDVVEYIKKTQE